MHRYGVGGDVKVSYAANRFVVDPMLWNRAPLIKPEAGLDNILLHGFSVRVIMDFEANLCPGFQKLTRPLGINLAEFSNSPLREHRTGLLQSSALTVTCRSV